MKLVMTHFMVLFHHFPQGTDKKYINLSIAGLSAQKQTWNFSTVKHKY